MRTFTKNKVTLLHCDCMEYMATLSDKTFDLAIVDPPYGISVNMNMGRKKGKRKTHVDKTWDNHGPNKTFFNELFRISKNQIIWGGNYFELPPTYHFIFWDKLVAEDMSFSDGEYAWTSYNRANRKYVLRNITGNKIHPTQKPVQLYKWLLKNYATPNMRIIDTHLGSGSSAIAAHDFGCEFVGMEIDEEYYNAAIKRFDHKTMQQKLF